MSTQRTPRRTWAQRLTFVAVVATAVACFATAASLAAGQWVLSQRRLVTLDTTTDVDARGGGSSTVVLPGGSTPTTADPAAPTTSIVLAEPDASNFLIVGADNGDCAGESTPTVGDRDDLGERSDTIMIWRANPSTDQLAVLSLPRDLYVDIAGGRRGRINSAYRNGDPTRLIETIDRNFGIPIDHYIQVDFCAFRRLVDAVGGVEVPFEFPARDSRAGLDVPTAGCVNLDGDMALAYVRSRYYQYEDPAGSGNWTTDGTSDFGRIARQQDFLRRVVAKVIAEGLYSPDVASALIQTNSDYLVIDSGLTLRRMLEFANTLRSLDPTTITTYRIESSTQNINGQSLEVPRVQGDNMRAILAVFRGEATLASAPEQPSDETDDGTTADEDDTGDDTGDTSDSPGDTSTDGPDATVPEVEADENVVGVTPDGAVTC